jgi:hypothetical protein
MYRAAADASLVALEPNGHQTGAPAAQHSARTRFPAGYRPPPLTLVSAYPEKSPYGLPPAILLAAIRAEIGRNPSLAPSAPKAGKFIWNPVTKAFAKDTSRAETPSFEASP